MDYLKNRDSEKLTTSSINLGLRSIELVKGKVEITSVPVILNNQDFSISNISMNCHENGKEILLTANDNVRLILNKLDRTINTRINGIVYDQSDIYNNEVPEEFENTLISLLVVADELTNESSFRRAIPAALKQFEDKVFVNAGLGRSGAVARTERDIRAFIEANTNCSLLGDIDSGCLFDDIVCMSAAVLECKCEEKE